MLTMNVYGNSKTLKSGKSNHGYKNLNWITILENLVTTKLNNKYVSYHSRISL